ncbi:MAG: 3-deoxy-D-manno-octulosonate 8-phosphate phosphatase [Dehalococcoidia bacterium]|nr:3-deoxy-D-manno-octulosonate 8-phosphate phosphatase [Dehalococcoidia bacterium]|tara:strand:- start:373 stop:885 length:513 start_codon:yes stop_codon:yes gene_type:complete
MSLKSKQLDLKTSIIFKNIKFIFFDFDGVFTDNSVYVSQTGEEMVKCSRYDGIGLKNLESQGIGKIVISSEKNPLVKTRCKKMNIECYDSVENKFSLVKEIIENKNLEISKVAFMGNDINDLECLSKVGLPIVVKDCHPKLIKVAKYITETLGGNGAVREVCDHLTNQTE